MHSLRFFVVSALLTLPFFASAQTIQDTVDKLLAAQKLQILQAADSQKSSVSKYLDVKINPPIPGPGEAVSITIESYLSDLSKANISWSLNGTVIARGMGRTTFTFQNGSSGKTTDISLYIVTNTGEVVTKDFSFAPVGVTIMWEADTYTPPFYKGKALISPQAGIRIVAVPDMAGTANPLGAGKLVYDWAKDGYPDASASGYGKNVYSFIGPKPLSNTKITLAVSSLDDSAQSEMQIYLPQVRPFILFYEKDPLFGVWYNKPLNSETTLTKKEFSISAEPYFFSNEATESATAPTLRYSWSVNGADVNNYGRTITLRNDSGAKGVSLVSLAMRGIVNTFQAASKDLRVNFTESPSASRPTF